MILYFTESIFLFCFLQPKIEGSFLEDPLFYTTLFAITSILTIFTIGYIYRNYQKMQENIREKEFELKLLRKSYDEFYENCPLLHFSLDPKGIITEYNKRVQESMKYRRKDVIGNPLNDILDTVPFGQLEEYLQNLHKQRCGHFEVDLKDSLGESHAGIAYISAFIDPSEEVVSIQMIILIYYQKKTFIQDEESKKRIEESIINKLKDKEKEKEEVSSGEENL